MKTTKQNFYLKLSIITLAQREEIRKIIIKENNLKSDFELEENFGFIICDEENKLCWAAITFGRTNQISFIEFEKLFK